MRRTGKISLIRITVLLAGATASGFWAGTAAGAGTENGAGVGAAVGTLAGHSLSDRIEMIDWSDPRRAVKLIDAAATSAERRLLDSQMLEVSGMVYVDVHRDADADAIQADLQASAIRGADAAVAAAHYVRAYALYQQDRYAAAGAELQSIDLRPMAASERYRFLTLRGNSLRRQRQAEAALPDLQAALELGQAMHDDARSLHALFWLLHLHLDTGDFVHASALLGAARDLAVMLGDEAALAEADICAAGIAAHGGDHAAERRLSLSALAHARLSGSNLWMAHALLNMSDSSLRTRDFKDSLQYSQQVLPLLDEVRIGGSESKVALHQGLAYIGMGKTAQGQRLVEQAIADTQSGGNPADARDLLRRYAETLEHSGYLMMAIQAYERYGELSERPTPLTVAATDRSIPAETAPRAHDFDTRQRDIEVQALAQREQRLRQRLAVTAGLLLAVVAALVWAGTRIRRDRIRLRFHAERDALTGLHSRPYFNEQVLSTAGTHPATGCVLLADLDHFKRINDSWGCAAGDAVLKAVSERLTGALDGSGALVRWGGEEFLYVLDAVTTEQANLTVEKLLHAVRREPIVWCGHSIGCTISVGYACFPMAGSAADISLDGAITLVDKALREAKRRGRDRACLISALRAAEQVKHGRDEAEAASVDRAIEMTEIGVAA